MEKNKATSPEKKAALEATRDEFKGTASRSQAARLLEALSRYSITTFEAMRYLDVYHCPARPYSGAFCRLNCLRKSDPSNRLQTQ